MEPVNHIAAELNELNSENLQPKLASAYTVPEGYFDNLAETVLQRISAEEAKTADEELAILSPLLHSLGKKTPFTVPSDYFDTLPIPSTLLEEQTASEEIASLSPLLYGVNKEMPFAVPEGYFEELAPQIPSAKVVSMKNTAWRKWAAVAAVAMGVVLSVLLFNQPTSQTNDPLAANEIKELDSVLLNDRVSMEEDASADLATISASELNAILESITEEEKKNFINQNKDLDFLF